jgi:hypothetical protein
MAFTPPGWFASIPWAEREDATDPRSALLEIRPGELDATVTALRRIFYQFQGTPEWTRLLTVIGELGQTMERGLGSINEARYVSTAEGDVLDEVGALVGRSRDGLSDDLYRLAIVAEAASTISSGTLPEILEVSRALIGDAARVRELWPATIGISAPDIPDDVFLILLVIMADMPAAGVAALLSTWDTDLTGGWGSITDPSGTEVLNPGTWSSTTGVDADSGRALWSTGQPIGGE